jgi:hypothetical protein
MMSQRGPPRKIIFTIAMGNEKDFFPLPVDVRIQRVLRCSVESPGSPFS